MKKLTLILLSSLLLLSFASCSKADIDTETDIIQTEATEITEIETEDNTMYDIIKGDIDIENEVVTAKVTSTSLETPEYSAAIKCDDKTLSDFAVEAEISLDSALSQAGIVVKSSESANGFIDGYYFCILDKKAYLYSLDGTSISGLKLTELARKEIEKPKSGETIKLRAEVSGKTARFYYLDDMEGVEPWPEFEFNLSDYKGNGYGFMTNGYGAKLTSLSLLDYSYEKPAKTYSNPVVKGEQVCDPGVLYYDGTYYLYSTSAPIGYYVFTSKDLVNWKNEGLCMGEAWSINKSGYYWAPEVIEKNGKFYMIASIGECLGFAVAESPLGPFVPCEKYTFDHTIDGHIFVDDDGQAYLFYVSWRAGHEYGIYACELEDDIVTIRPGTGKLIMKPESKWEKNDGHVTEGPFVIKHNGLYYLTYSGSGYQDKAYSIGYATASSPLGDYTRYEANPVLSYTSKIYGTGHHSITTAPDGESLYIVYHCHASTTSVHPRYTCIDKLRFAPTDKGIDRIEVYGPTHTSQPYPNN